MRCASLDSEQVGDPTCQQDNNPKTRCTNMGDSAQIV